MSDDAPVVWLERDPPREDAVRALEAWARTRGLKLGTLETRVPTIPADPSLGERAEAELERARLALATADADAVERALARAEAELRAHPEIPQAAWLRAEVERSWSARWLRLAPRDEARARVAWENAEALDGGRVPGIGETRFPSPPRRRATVVIEGGAGPNVELRLDGVVLAASARSPETRYVADVAAGEHQLVATVDGRVAFASWVTFAGTDPAPVRIHLGESGACAAAQLAEVQAQGDVVRAPGVACPRWIAAIAGERRGAVRVARCRGDACGPLLEWRVEPLTDHGPPQPVTKTAPWPAWATWTLAGAGAIAVGSIALVATGVLETRPVEPRFVVGGARQQ